MKRRMLSPMSTRHFVSEVAAARPSGPDERMTSPTIVLPSRYVPLAIIAARHLKTAPVCVVTEQTWPSRVPISTISACLVRRFSCRSSVSFIIS